MYNTLHFTKDRHKHFNSPTMCCHGACSQSSNERCSPLSEEAELCVQKQLGGACFTTIIQQKGLCCWVLEKAFRWIGCVLDLLFNYICITFLRIVSHRKPLRYCKNTYNIPILQKNSTRKFPCIWKKSLWVLLPSPLARTTFPKKKNSYKHTVKCFLVNVVMNPSYIKSKHSINE